MLQWTELITFFKKLPTDDLYISNIFTGSECDSEACMDAAGSWFSSTIPP